MSELVDAKERSRIASEFKTTFFVEAAAGTGKTTALVGRIVSMVRLGHGTLVETVAVTFTEPAAGEMLRYVRLGILLLGLLLLKDQSRQLLSLPGRTRR